MKFTNVKQLIIKFMGGGIINFPTRFLRWVKINGDNNSNDSGDEDSTEIDYEAIYQFYKQKVIESIPEEYLEQVIIPEHYSDIENGNGNSNEYINKSGIWYSESLPLGSKLLFCEIDFNSEIEKNIYFGTYNFIQI